SLCVFAPMRPATVATLCPYTTLFRSPCRRDGRSEGDVASAGHAVADIDTLQIGSQAGDDVGPFAVEGQPADSRSQAEFVEAFARSEEHTSELQSPDHLVCRLLLEKKN